MNITILDNREIIIDTSDSFGTQNENNATTINFNFPESLMNANKKIVFITNDGDFWDLITDNTYVLTNAITKYKSITAYAWLVDVENEIDFRSKMWKMTFNNNQEADDVVPTPEEISAFDTMIAQLNTAIGEVNNIDIDVLKVGTTTTVSIVNKQGTTKTAEINDGTDYIITKEDYQEIARIAEQDIQVEIPSKTSDLTNDSGFISEELDPTVPNHVKNISQTDINNWNSKSDFSGNYNDLSNKPTIPTALKDLSDDSTHRTVTDTEKSTWNNKSDFSGNYNDLSNKPTIPTKTSDLSNDSGFINKTVNDLTNYTLKTNTGSLIDLEINGTTYVVTLSLKDIDGTVISTDTIDLPLESVVVGGSYDSTNQKIVLTLQNGNTVDIPVGALVAGLQTEITSANKLDSDLIDDSNSGNKFTTTSEKNTWNAKYDKPVGGIPSTDLSSAIQTSLGKADTAVQDDSGKEDKTNKVTSIDSNSTDTQYPSAKCVYDLIGDIESILETLDIGGGV